MPLRAEACHCGMSRARAEEMAAFATPDRRPPRPTRPVPPGRLFAALPRDIKALVIGSALVTVSGLGWAVFGAPAALFDPGPAGPGRPGPAPGAETDAHTHAAAEAPVVEVSAA